MEPPSLRKVSRCATTPTYHRAFRLSRESLKRNVFVTIESSCVIPTQCGCWNRTSILPLPQPAYRVSFDPPSFEMPYYRARSMPRPLGPYLGIRSVYLVPQSALIVAHCTMSRKWDTMPVSFPHSAPSHRLHIAPHNRTVSASSRVNVAPVRHCGGGGCFRSPSCITV